MEEDISDAIYGDLGDFEFNEKLKEQCQKIEDLRDQLNQSIVTITDLQTKMKGLTRNQRQLEENSSSLLLTARLELSRKDRNIGLLQRKIDNQLFRRRKNNCSIGVQTDTDTGGDVHPLISRCTVNNNDINSSEQLLHQPVNDLSKFRIPKKNPFARHETEKEPRDQIRVCNGKETEHDEPICQFLKKNTHARRHEEKDRLNDRRDDNRRPVTHNSKGLRDYKKGYSNSNDRNRDRSGNNRKRGRSSSDETDRHAKRRSDSPLNRQRSRSRPMRSEDKVTKAKSPKKRQLKHGKGDRVDEVKSRKGSVTNLKEKDLEAILIAQKKILNEIDNGQHSELHEKSSKEHHRRSRSKNDDPTTMTINEEGKQSEQHEKSSKDHRRRKNSNSDDLATVTASQEGQQSEQYEKSSKEHCKRNSSKTDDPSTITANPEGKQSEQQEKSSKEHRKRRNPSTDDPATMTTSRKGQQAEHHEKSFKEHRQRTSSKNDDPATMTTNQEGEQSELHEKSSRDHRRRSSSKNDDLATMTTNKDGNKGFSSANDASSAEVIADSENTIEVLSVDTAADSKNPNLIDTTPYRTTEVLPVTSEDAIQEPPLVEAPDSTNDLKLCSSLEEVKALSESTAENVIAVEVPKTAQLPNDEKSNSPMDIDYELMEHLPVENQTNLPIEETDRKNLVENSPKRMTPIVNKDVTGDESFMAMEVDVHKGNCLSSTLNSSQERHILSKSSEYTVEDAGYEIRIFLTKKRKKNKNVKVTS